MYNEDIGEIMEKTDICSAESNKEIDPNKPNSGGDYFEHKHDEKCKDGCSHADIKKDENVSIPSYNQTFEQERNGRQMVPAMLRKEMKHLKRGNYDEISKKFPKAYVIRNKRNDIVLEICAASSIHACNLVGWKPRHTTVIDVINSEDVGKGIWRKEEELKTEKDGVIDTRIGDQNATASGVATTTTDKNE